jgi:hypothetical protein
MHPSSIVPSSSINELTSAILTAVEENFLPLLLGPSTATSKFLCTKVLCHHDINETVFADCSWSLWTNWTSCSLSCGNSAGIRSRIRSQMGSNFCHQTERETRPCFVNKCPTNCAWGGWAQWTSCSQSCGTGQKTRTRNVEVRQQFGGTDCLPSDGVESEVCLAHTCPVNGGWGQWSRWGYCNATCGQGHKTRTRLCDKPRPENGGYFGFYITLQPLQPFFPVKKS